MNTTDSVRDLEKTARRRVRAQLGVYTHALVFVLVNLGLFAIHSATGGYRWNVWPLMGWGLGFAIHAVVIFLSLQGDGLRQRMFEREMERLRHAGRKTKQNACRLESLQAFFLGLSASGSVDQSFQPPRWRRLSWRHCSRCQCRG